MIQKEPKKQHYIPQFLLTKFAIDKKKHIHVFDLKTGNSFISHIRDTAHENSFYHHPIHGNKMEFELGKQETLVAPIIENIISNGSIAHLTHEEQYTLGIFTISQMMRVNSFRESLSQTSQLFIDNLKGESIAPNSQAAEFLSFLQTQDIKAESIDMQNETSKELLPYILNKHLLLLKAPKGESFYISDNPIVKYNYQPQKNRGNLGIGLKGIEIHFPISPKYCLSYLCSELIQEIRQAVTQQHMAILTGSMPFIDLSEAMSMLNQIDNKSTKELSSANMEHHNYLQVQYCSRFIYSSDNNFQLVKEMLIDNPQFATKTRVVNGMDLYK